MTSKIYCILWLLLSTSALTAQPVPFLVEDSFSRRAAGSDLSRQNNVSGAIIPVPKQSTYDTVYVSDRMTTYMIFPEAVSIMDLGSKSYTGKIESGNMLYLKPLKANVAPSSLLVRTIGERIYLHYIAYREHPRKIFWDFRPDSLQSDFNKAGSQSESKEEYTRKLGQLGELKGKRLAIHQANGLVLRVSNLAIDKRATYLLLQVENFTSLPYQIDYVSFAYKERRSRKSQRRIQPAEHVVEPLAQVATPVVAPLGTETLGYALPLYAGTNRNFLEVTLREANGNRSLKIRVPARKIARSLYLPSPEDTHANPSTMTTESHVSQKSPQ
jgi:hypothetical protein